MATITVARRCLKCKETLGTVSCQGCKGIFCTKHMTEHRKELSDKFHRHLLDHKVVLVQLLGEEKQNESSKKEILSRINQWEKNMIERIRDKADLARERLDQLIGNEEKIIIKTAQELTKKIYEKYKTEELLEDDIERLKQNIVHVKQALEKLIRQPEVELYIEPSHMIDWNHLLCVREKSVKMASALVEKQTSGKDNRNVKSDTASNQRRKSTSSHNSQSSSSSVSSDEERDSQEMNSSYNSDLFMRRLSNEHINTSVQTKPLPPKASVPNTLLSPDVERKTRRPLRIVDPASHKLVEVVAMSSSDVDISLIPSESKPTSETTSSSSSATDKTQ